MVPQDGRSGHAQKSSALMSWQTDSANGVWTRGSRWNGGGNNFDFVSHGRRRSKDELLLLTFACRLALPLAPEKRVDES